MREIYSESSCSVSLYFGLSIPCSRHTKWHPGSLVLYRHHQHWIPSKECCVRTRAVLSSLCFLLGWQSLHAQVALGGLLSAWAPTRATKECQKGVSLWTSRRNRLKFRMPATCATWKTMSFYFLFQQLCLFSLILSKRTGVWRESLQVQSLRYKWQVLQALAISRKYTLVPRDARALSSSARYTYFLLCIV